MRIFLLFISALIFGQAYGQSSYRNPYFTPFSQYYFQQSMINPAYVGNENQPQFWGSLQNSKEEFGKGKAYNALIQGRMYTAPINYGFIFGYEDFNDSRLLENFARRGDFRQWMAGIQASFDFDVGEAGIGRVGLTGALMRYRTEPIELDSLVTGGQTSDQNLRKILPSLDIGVVLIYGDFEMGMSVTNSNQPKLSRTTVALGAGGNNAVFRRSSYITFLYNWKIAETLSLHPQILFRLGDGQLGGGGIGQNPNVPGQVPQNSGVNLNGMSIDLTMLVNYYDLAFLGMSYKPPLGQANALDFVYKHYMGTIMTGLRIANAYQVSLSWDLNRPNIINKERYRKFEVGFGAFLFDDFYFVEEEEPVDY